METAGYPCESQSSFPGLGNFLSGMETLPYGALGGRRQLALETSLVEWKRIQSIPRATTASGLGNFLSGMETGGAQQLRRLGHTLETSLVEWKHGKVWALVEGLWAPWKLP